MKKLAILILVLFIGLLLPLGFVTSETTFFNSFPGFGHNYDGCHGDSIAFSSGTVRLNSSDGDAVSVGATFTISVTIQDFTDAAGQLITLGFSDQRSNNGQFGFEPGYTTDLPVDLSGNILTQNFTVTAPNIGGVFTITADALSGESGYVELKWIYGSLEITVQGSAPIELPSPILVLTGTLASVGVLIIVSSLMIKFLIDSLKKKRVEI